jgi:hypothetical protein
VTFTAFATAAEGAHVTTAAATAAALRAMRIFVKRAEAPRCYPGGFAAT